MMAAGPQHEVVPVRTGRPWLSGSMDSWRPRRISLQIEDDGIGFDVKRADSETDQVHLGLVGVRERMQIIGGTLQIRSAAGHGTTVIATAER